jgi:DNA transposition AAA+ family ATPase
MPTLETTDPKLARRCRYAQHRGQKATVTISGALVTGLVHAVMQVKASNPTRWIITVTAKQGNAA